MAKQIFSEDGVQVKLQELYALSDANLQTQAKQAGTDFKSWLNSNFTFTSDQANFLGQIDARFLSHAGAVTATALGGRLPISLQLQLPPGTWSSKYIVVQDDTDPKHHIKTGYSVTGSVTFIVAYSE